MDEYREGDGQMGYDGGVDSVRMPDGKVLLTVPEAAALWARVGNIAITPGIYRRRVRSGHMAAVGVDVSDGPRYMTDLDSLLAYFERELVEMQARMDVIMDERRRDLEEWGRT